MKNLGLAARKALKRHAEALLIILFLVADYFLSGWAVMAVTIGALLYVVAPAIPMFMRLDSAGRITYVKAVARSPKAQRVGIIWFGLVAIRWVVASAQEASLFEINGNQSTLNLLLAIPRVFHGIEFIWSPVFVYGAAILAAVALRAGLKPTKEDPDLIQRRQIWCGAVQAVFMAAFLGSIASIVLNPSGPGYMVSNWFLASACDANFFMEGGIPGDKYLDPSFMPKFDTFILSSLSLLAFVFLFQPVLRLSALLTSFCWRVVSATSAQNLIEAFLEALQLPKRALSFKESHPLVRNAMRTAAWLLACFCGLFWVFGFAGGPLGLAIENWMLASALDANVGQAANAPDWLFKPEFRIFLASVVALYGAAPLAVTGAILLPFAGTRRIVLNADGLLFTQGPYFALGGRQFRLWSDVKSITAKRLKPRKDKKPSAEFKLVFRSGGGITFTNQQIAPHDIRILLDSVNEYAGACEIEPEVFTINQELIDAEPESIASDGMAAGGINAAAPQDFRSTIFVPYVSGQCLPGTKIRVTKQLASKPLCAVYLARDEQGRMVVVKQFYLADENDETRALKKTLDREYELLSRLDHPGLAKVYGCFSEGNSTYLMIEHRIGSDLRETVKEHGARSESVTIAWAKQLCEIMMYLHGQEPSVLHRDLTPDNVIAGEDGRLRLIDFGAAREFLDGITGTMLGKHCYVAPEQLRGEATQRSDIYSFGGTLYFLLTGRDPVALKQSAPGDFIAMSEELDRLVRDCTEFDEEKRPQSFAEVLERLEDIGKGFWIKLPSEKKEAVSV